MNQQKYSPIELQRLTKLINSQQATNDLYEIEFIEDMIAIELETIPDTLKN